MTAKPPGAPAAAGSVSAFVAFSSLAQICVFLALFLPLSRDGVSEQDESLIYFLFFALSPVLSVVGFRMFGDALPSGIAAGRSRLATAIVLLAPLAIAAFGLSSIAGLIYFTYEVPAPPAPFSYWRFLAGSVAFAAIIAALAWLLRPRGHAPGTADLRARRLPLAASIVGYTAIASLFDIYMMIDTFCFAPYIAPAFLAAEGQIPMVDVFSQYGANFLVLTAAFKVLPQSFFTVAAIVGVLNILLYMVFTGIAVNISRNKVPVFLAAIGCVFFIHSAHLYNINYSPSVFAMRFLPPLLLAFSLTLLRSDRLFSGFSAFCLVVCSLWSLEALVFGTLTYSTYILLCAIGQRHSAAHVARSLLYVAGGVVLPHLVLAAIYVAVIGVPPDYLTYLQLVLFHFKAGQYWKLPVEPGIRVWAIFGFVYATGLAVAAHVALRSFRDGRPFDRGHATVGAVSVLGMLMLYYYIGRSSTPILMFISPPLFLIALAALDRAIGEVSERGVRADRPAEMLAPTVLIAAVIGFALMGGVFADKFFRPFSQHLSNSSLLRAWIPPFGESPVSIAERLRTMRTTTAAAGSYPKNEAGGSLTYTHAENQAAFELAEQLHDGKRRILVFIADPVPVLFHTPPVRRQRIAYPPHQVGVAYPAVDGLSATLHARALSALDAVAQGDIVLIGELPRSPLDDDALDKLRRVWTLCKLPSKPQIAAYILRPKQDSCDPGARA